MGGERCSKAAKQGYSEKAQCTGNSPSYLEHIRNSLQKPIGGRSKKPKRGRSLLAFFSVINNAALLLYIEGRGSTQSKLAHPTYLLICL